MFHRAWFTSREGTLQSRDSFSGPQRLQSLLNTVDEGAFGKRIVTRSFIFLRFRSRKRMQILVNRVDLDLLGANNDPPRAYAQQEVRARPAALLASLPQPRASPRRSPWCVGWGHTHRIHNGRLDQAGDIVFSRERSPTTAVFGRPR